MTKTADTDKTPIELRTPLLEAMLQHVIFDGWSTTSLLAAANDLGVSSEMAELAFPRGAIEVLELHLKTADEALSTKLEELDLPSMKIRDRITVAVKTRLEQQMNNREIVRQGLATLAMPQNIALGSKTLWATADTMWRAAGDTSTDHNWYTKRMTLSGVYSAVVLFWLNDESDNCEDTWAFLDRRIENVMQFEKAKFQIRKVSEKLPSISRFLSHLRYPASH